MDVNNLTTGQALLVSLVGFLTVFVILYVISLLIQLSARCINGKPKQKEPSPAPEAIKQEAPEDNLEIVAVLSAAIAEFTNSSQDSFVIKAIRKTESSGSGWISAARTENME